VFNDGRRSYFPVRIPRTVKFLLDDGQNDPYATLYADNVVETVNALNLPRYGLGGYIAKSPKQRPTPVEAKQLESLSRAGKRLMGFCRTNLFKRLESGGPAFIQSLERHILRNFVYLHAIENDLPLPIGTQGAEFLDARLGDRDIDDLLAEPEDAEDNGEANGDAAAFVRDEASFRKRAAEV